MSLKLTDFHRLTILERMRYAWRLKTKPVPSVQFRNLAIKTLSAMLKHKRQVLRIHCELVDIGYHVVPNSDTPMYVTQFP